MKVLQFTIPVQPNNTILARTDLMPYFYPYLHRHEEMQITWVQQGEGTLVVNNNMRVFHNNEIFIIGANQPHIFKSDPSYFSPKSKKTIASLDIFFNPKGLFESLFNIPEMKGIRDFIKQNQIGFKVPQEHVAEVSNKMLLIKQCEDGIQKVLHFIELLKRLSTTPANEALASQPPPSSLDEHEGIRISTIYNYIMSNYERDITLEEVAGQACMTPQAFCRYFKKHTRYTFVAFLNEIRINEACKKLTDGNYSNIASIAYNSGFNSITNFNRVFKSVTGKSPSEYLDKFTVNIEIPGHSIVQN